MDPRRQQCIASSVVTHNTNEMFGLSFKGHVPISVSAALFSVSPVGGDQAITSAGEQQCHYMSPRHGILEIPRKMLSGVKLKRAKEEEY